jgi:hypothetical protein
LKHQRHFESATVSREALQIGELIADLDRIVRLIMNGDIAAEEEQAKASYLSHPTIIAMNLAARRSNLMDTIALLEQRLIAIYGAQLEEA